MDIAYFLSKLLRRGFENKAPVAGSWALAVRRKVCRPKWC